jgi:hypothetical protein
MARGRSSSLCSRTRVLAALTALALVLAVPAFAHHEPVKVTLASKPTLNAGKPWGLMLVVKQDGKAIARKPLLQAQLGATKRSFNTVATARKGYYRARVTLPRAGKWILTAKLGRRIDALGKLTVR